MQSFEPYTPVLWGWSTPPIVLVPFCEKQITQDYIDWLNDPEVTQHSRQHGRVHTRESCIRYIKQFDGCTSWLWGIYTPSSHIGNVAVNSYCGQADVTIMIGRKELWNQGCGTEAMRIAISWLKGIGVNPTAGTRNPAMARVIEKLGMRNSADMVPA